MRSPGTDPLPDGQRVSYGRRVFEELEQIPWSQLVSKPKRPKPWAIVVLVGLVVAAVAVARFRASSPAEETAVVAVPEVSPSVPVERGPEMMLSEADLQASEGSGELMALGAAVVEVRATSSPSHYVEWAVAEELTPLGGGTWSVRVAFQVLVPGPDGPVRSTIRRVDVPIAVVDGRSRRVGPLNLSSYEEAAPAGDMWALEPTPLTSALRDAVAPLFADWGEVELESAGTAEGLTRIIVDTGGMSVSVWLDETNLLPRLPVPAMPAS